jgi:hypothetical protein
MSDLDTLSLPRRAWSDYTVHDPVHAWDGAGQSVAITVACLGPDITVQIGRNADGSGLTMVRMLSTETGAWSAWTSLADVGPAKAREAV